MYYVYVIQSLKDGNFYTGFTNNLTRRIEEHNNKLEFATKSRVPFELIYYEASTSKEDALSPEKYLKSGKGKRYLKTRLKQALQNDDLVCGRVPSQIVN